MITQSKTNLEGSKEAAPKISKTVHSANVRQRRIMRSRESAKYFGDEYCNGCGFRIRGKNHAEGAYHNGTVKVCHRGR